MRTAGRFVLLSCSVGVVFNLCRVASARCLPLSDKLTISVQTSPRLHPSPLFLAISDPR